MGGRPASVCLSVCPSVNNPTMFRHRKSCGVHIGSVDTLGDPNLGDLKLGHCDLLYGFYGSKFSFCMLSNGKNICFLFKDCKGYGQTDQQLKHTYQSLSLHTTHLTLNLFSRSWQTLEIWLSQIWKWPQIFTYGNVCTVLHVLWRSLGYISQFSHAPQLCHCGL